MQIVSGLLSGVSQLITTLVPDLINIISLIINLIVNVVTSLIGSIIRESLSLAINSLINQVSFAEKLAVLPKFKSFTLDFFQYLLLAESEKLANLSISLNLIQEITYVTTLQQQIIGTLYNSNIPSCPTTCSLNSIQVQNCSCTTSPQVQTFLNTYYQYVTIALQLGSSLGQSLPTGLNASTLSTEFLNTKSTAQDFYLYILNNYGMYDINIIQTKLDAFVTAFQALDSDFKANFQGSNKNLSKNV